MDAPAGGQPLPLHGGTRVYAILGDPIAQVGSPRVFNELFRAHGAPAVLVPLHVAPADLPAVVDGLRRSRNVDGFILTIPHKVAVLPLLDGTGDAGRRIGAVNAVRREADGRLVGDNFDGQGCVEGLRAAGHDLRGRRALVVGCGGAGAAVAHALADAGVASLTVADLDAAKADALAAGLRRAHPHLGAAVGPSDPAAMDLVVNATPLGMAADDPLPLDPERLAPGTLVVDVVLLPTPTALLRAAAARGCATQPGRVMLEGQAVAIGRFFGVVR